MLQKINRLTRNKDFDRVFKTGQSFYSKVLGVKTAPNGLKVSRFGFLIGVKVSKKAVVRNLFKRRLRETIRKELPSLKSSQDVVIIVFNQILDKNFEDLQKIINSGFKRLKLYK